MIAKEVIKNLVEQAISGTQMFVVDITVRAGNIITIELDSEAPIGIEDCIAVSRKIEAGLDRNVEDFELEVGSAGLTSPFKLPRQYQKNIGREIEILTKEGKKMSGVLKSADENGFIITISKKVKPEGSKRKVEVLEDLPFSYSEVKYTKQIIRFK